MKVRCKKKQAARTGQAVLLVFVLFLFGPAALAAPNPECAAGQHLYVETRRVAPAAMEDGEVTYLCNVCGQQYTEILYATSHTWGPWVTDKEPTCTEPGEKHRTCDRALSHDEYAVLPALGHSYTASVTAEPGCEEEGITTFTCSRCGDRYTEPVPPIGHAYEETISKEPTCLEAGEKRFVCAHDPAHTYKEEIPAFGSHSFGGWVVETQPQEGVEGMEIRICVHDGFAEYRPIEALPVTLPAPSAPNPFPVVDVILVGANVGLLTFFSILLSPYIVCLLYLKKRRDAIKKRDALRKEVEERYGFT